MTGKALGRAAAPCCAELLEGRMLLSVSMVKEVTTYIGSNSPVGPGGYLYFAGTDTGHGTELWRTDGTTAGTTLVADINPTDSSNPSDMINVNGVLYFWANDGTYGRELWRSDGTAAGTRMVTDLWPGAAGSTAYTVTSDWFGTDMDWPVRIDPDPTQIAGTLFFAATSGTDESSLWCYRAGMASPQLVPDDGTGGRVRNPENLIDSGGRLYFSAYDDTHGTELWVAEWTGNYATMVRDINPGYSGSDPAALTDLDGTLHFFARSEAGGAQLWKSDSSYARTVPVSNWSGDEPLAVSVGLVRSGSALYYVTTDRDHTRWDLGKYAAGSTPSLIRRFGSSDQPQFLVDAGGTLLFRVGEPGDDDLDQEWNDPGSVWIEDFTDALWDIYGGDYVWVDEYGQVHYGSPGDAYTDAPGYELWKTAGTSASTALIRDFSWGPFDLTSVGGTVYFTAQGDEADDARLWRSTVTTTEIVPGLTPDFTPDARGMKSYNGRLLFVADWAPPGTWTVPNVLWVLDPSKDFYEENDSKAAVDARAETEPYSPNLGLVNGTRTLTDLSALDDANDWYKFRIDQTALTGAQVQISFINSLGDLDLYVYKSDGATLVGSSTSGTNSVETVSLAGQPAGTYYIRVYAYGAKANPSYRMDVTVPVHPDRFEANDSFATAANLGTLGKRIESGLTFHTATDVDYFRFTAMSTTKVNLAMDYGQSVYSFGMPWAVYNASQQSILSWTSFAGTQVTAAVNVTAGQTYYIKVFAEEDRYASGLPYSLTIDVGSNPGRISGSIFQDHNADGTQDNTEGPRQFAAVYLDLNANGAWDSAEPRTTSAADGSYNFNVPYGEYLVRQDPWGGYGISAPESQSYQVVLTQASPEATGCVFGIYDAALVQEPYGGGTNWLPTKIEAEDYDTGGLMIAYDDVTQGNSGDSSHRNDDVDMGITGDDGTSFIGWTEAGEWLEYTIEVPAEADYDLELRVAGFGGQLRALFNGIDRTGAIALPSTGDWQTWTTFNKTPVHLLAGKQVMRLAFDTGGFNVNWIRLSGHHTPFSGTPALVPGTIEAEDFDQGAEGVAYHDTSVGNEGWYYRHSGVDIEMTMDAGGGYDIGWIGNGEWLDYTFDAANPGLHNIALRVTSIEAGGKVRVLIDGVDRSGAVAIPVTGGWQTWTTITAASVNLTAGQHVMRLAFESAGDFACNLNWIQITRGANVVQGTSAANTFRARKNAAGDRIQVFVSSALFLPPKFPTYDWPIAAVDRLEFQGLGGNDTLVIDSTYGSPIPAGGFSFDGGIGSDLIRYIGTADNDAVTVTTTEVRSGTARYTHANVEQFRIETGAGDDALTVTGNLPSLPLFLGGEGVNRLTLNGGAYLAEYDLGGGSASLDLYVVNTDLRIGAAQHLNGLNLVKGGTMALLPGGDRTLITRGLLIDPDSILDLNDNTLVLRGQPDDNEANLEMLRGLIRAFIREDWGITSHTASGDPTMGLISLLNQQADASPIIRMAADQQAWSDDILVRTLLHGDSDLNGRIDGSDYLRMDRGFLSSRKGYINGDVTGDGWVNGDDFYLIDVAFLGQQATLAPGIPAAAANAAARIATPFCTTPLPALDTGALVQLAPAHESLDEPAADSESALQQILRKADAILD